MSNFDPTKVFFEDERTALFIDGSNLYSASRHLGFDVDYNQLLEFFAERTALVHANYYSAILETDEYSPLKPLTDWLAYNGYNFKTKAAKEYTDATGRRRVKGNMDVEITTDMLVLSNSITHAVLFSGDNDFRYVIEELQRRGVKVTVISTKNSSPPMVGDEIRRQANRFVDLSDIGSYFTRRQIEPRNSNSVKRFEPADA